jgi:thymidylate synthase
MIAHVCRLDAGEFVHTLGDAHVYVTHMEALREQCARTPRLFPRLHIKRQVSARAHALHALR